MKKFQKRLLSFMLACLLVFTTCMNDSTIVQAAESSPTKLTLSSKSTSMSVGETLTLKVKAVKPAKASKKVTWVTSNKKIATVSSKGKVKAKKNGTVTITAKSKSNPKVTAKCKIKVYKATKKLQLTSSKSYTLTVGETQTLSAKVTNPKKGAAPVTWSSKDSKVAEVTTKGKVTAVSEGTTTITGKSGKKKVSVKITVKKAESSEPGNPTPSTPGNPDDPTNPDSGNPNDTTNPDSGNPNNPTNPDPSTPDNPDDPMPSDPDSVTRAEWVAMLVDKMGYTINKDYLNLDEDGDILYEYGDIKGHVYAEKIEAAYCYGIIPSVDSTDGMVHDFKPDSAVTREFAAYTVVHALEFVAEEALDSSDADELQYPLEDKLAVDLGIFSLQDGAFCPEDVLQAEEKEKLEAWIDDILAGREIDENHEDVIEYQDEVVQETAEITDYTVTEEGFVVLPYTEVTAGLTEGDILILPETEDFPTGLMLRVDSISVEENESVQVTGEFPELEEVYSKIDMEGCSSKLAGEIELEEDVAEVSVTDADSPMLFVNEKAEDTVSTPKLNVEEEIELEYGNVTFSFGIPEIRYKLDMQGKKKLQLNEFYIEVPSVASAVFKIEGEQPLKKKKLATIPIELTYGFSVEVAVYLDCNAEGEITITYALNNAFGVQYVNGYITPIKSMTPTFDNNITIEITVTAGIDVQIQLYWAKEAKETIRKLLGIKKEVLPFYSVGTQVGIAANGTNQIRDTGLECLNYGLWLYWKLSVGQNSNLGNAVPQMEKGWTIFDDSNSPVKKDIHYEKQEGEKEYKYVQECTYNGELASGTWAGMDWSIDGAGRLEITDNHSGYYGSSTTMPEWINYSKKIKTAVVTATHVTDTNQWFYYCTNLVHIDMSQFDTSQVTDMGGMFYGCSSLESLDLNELDTSQVTNMSGMFSGCSGLTNLDVSGLDTSQVTSMYAMFSGCSGLTNLDVSGLDTSQVTSIYAMFRDCSGLTNLDVSGLDTSQVTNMNNMFEGCSSLTNLDVSGLDTSQVTSMYAMFRDCSGLTNLDVSGLNTSQVTSMSEMFYGCSSLESLDLNELDTSQVTSMSSMFSGCSGLTDLDVRGLDTSQVTSMGGMFSGCSGLTDLDVSGLNTSQVTYMYGMFLGCSGLTNLDVSGLDTSQVTDMSYMFEGCSSLINLDVRGLNTSQVTRMSGMFEGCSGLIYLNLSGFDASQVRDMTKMLSDCSSLIQLEVPVNVTVSCGLPGGREYSTWTDADGNEYYSLPLNITQSFTITR